MKFLKNIITSLCGGAIITMISMTVSFLITMFQSSNPGVSYAFFKTLFFENQIRSNGSLFVSLGFTGEYYPILVSIVLISLTIQIFLFFYTQLNKRKKILLEPHK